MKNNNPPANSSKPCDVVYRGKRMAALLGDLRDFAASIDSSAGLDEQIGNIMATAYVLEGHINEFLEFAPPVRRRMTKAVAEAVVELDEEAPVQE